MLVIFVHGWSVRNTDTYGELPRYLELQTNLQVLPSSTVGDSSLFRSGQSTYARLVARLSKYG